MPSVIHLKFNFSSLASLAVQNFSLCLYGSPATLTGIACPTTSKLVELIHEVEQGRRKLTDDNLLELIPQ